MSLQRKEKGFTIIEVVLVLAIAGLIFLMVFIALPALQRNQRDTARKSDVASVVSGVVAYTGNNRGIFPTTASLTSYAKDVSDNTTSVVVNGTAGMQNITTADGIVTVTQSSTCGESTGGADAKQVLAAGTTRQFTVVTKLESGDGAYFCQNS
jgi:prepilin-type N-terminal cleavage/methylation domain-containing protein